MPVSARELARKSVHIAMGFVAFSLRYLDWWQALLLAVLAVVHNLFLFPLYGGRRVYRGVAAERGLDPGIALYPITVLALIACFPNRLEIAAVGWGLLAFGDGVATVAGLLFGRVTGALPWNRDKSWAGLAGFLLAGIPMALILYTWTSGIALDQRLTIVLVAVSVIVAVLETLRLGLDDNIVVGLSGGVLLYAGLMIDPAQADTGAWLARLPWALGVNLVLGVLAYKARSVDFSGLVHGALLGTALWVFGGWPAFVALLVFFVVGSAATKIGYKTKLAEGTAQEKGGARGAANAWANAGAGVGFALLAALTPHTELFGLAIAAAFATAVSDTLGSEIGQAFGKRTFLITSFRPVPRGTDGAVSLEGTLAGVLGSAVLGAIAWVTGLTSGFGAMGLGIVVIAAFVGTTIESYLGALLERRNSINNEAQNFLNTLVGGLVAIGLAMLWGMV